MDQLAILVDSVSFGYNKLNSILQNINLHVPKGQIYALLGSNGCGKTTILKILLGRIKAHHGSVHIFDQKVSGSSTQLRHVIGYMPQDIALNPHLNIEETFYYFAKVNHVRDQEFVRERIKNYLDMLGLTDSKQYVWQLSGGQKRLLSLGVTLIYEPQILLLDEPTVGVDSVIRSKIWNHLNDLCRFNGTTVLITTHYIDEAKHSNLVGFVNHGRLLAEESPQTLMNLLECTTLEDVFYKLCKMQNDSTNDQVSYFRYNINMSTICDSSSGIQNDIQDDHEKKKNHVITKVKGLKLGRTQQYHVHCSNELNLNASQVNQLSKRNVVLRSVQTSNEVVVQETEQSELQSTKPPCSSRLINIEHLHALAYREMIHFKKNLMSFLLFLMIPLVSIFLFELTYGSTPKSIPIAIYNNDSAASTADQMKLSDIYLDAFNTSMVKMKHFPSEQAAFDSIKSGQNTIAVAFRANFSNLFLQRYLSNAPHVIDVNDDINEENQLIQNGSIHIYIDMSRTLNVRFLNRSLLMALQQMAERYSSKSGMNPYFFSTPIQVQEILYGTLEPDFQDLFQAGIILITLLATAVFMTSMKIVIVRDNGCLERDLNQGVKPFELMLTFHLSTLGSIVIQVLITLIFAFFVVKIQLEGSFVDIFFLALLATSQGMFLGTIISVFFQKPLNTLIVSFSMLVIIFFTAGILWPAEGMPRIVQKVFLINPIMLPIRSMRSIMLRGWSASNPSVLIAYITSFSNSAVLFVIGSLLFHYSVSPM